MGKLVLGIDPGTALLGYGLVEQKGNQLKLIDKGCVRTKAGTPPEKRLKIIYQELSEVIEAHRPDEIAVEEIFFSRNVKTAISVAQARGIILLTAANAEIETHEYKPNQVKQAITGYGMADKRQVQEMVKRLLKMKEIVKPDDIADALAVAICHINTTQNAEIKKEYKRKERTSVSAV